MADSGSHEDCFNCDGSGEDPATLWRCGHCQGTGMRWMADRDDDFDDDDDDEGA